jgi:hypothetical protein
MQIFQTFFQIGSAVAFAMLLFGVVPTLILIKIFHKKN